MTADRPSYFLPPGKRPREGCAVCGGAVRENKPTCSDHINRMPYVARLLEVQGHELGGRFEAYEETKRKQAERRAAKRRAS